MIDHNLLRPIDAQVGKAHFPHHCMTGLVPQLTAHVAIIFPWPARCFRDDACHHFRHINLSEALVKHHQRLGFGRERLVVKKDLGIDSHVVGVREALVSAWHTVVLERLRRVMTLKCFGRCWAASWRYPRSLNLLPLPFRREDPDRVGKLSFCSGWAWA